MTPALIVDEGQDFHEDWWLPLLTLLVDPDAGVFYVFHDDNQAIYRKPGGLPDQMAHARLSEDWRNPNPIFDAVMNFYRGEKVVCTGPDGPPIGTMAVSPDEVRHALSRLLHRLITEGKVPASDVVVLTPHSVTHSQVAGKVGAFNVSPDAVGKNDVRLESIYRYKGLESKVVIVCEVDRFVEEDFTRLMYVACSRARSFLAVLLSEEQAAAMNVA